MEQNLFEHSSLLLEEFIACPSVEALKVLVSVR